jgi:small GTP-binding protein
MQLARPYKLSNAKPLNVVLVGDPKVGKSTLISKCHELNPTFGEEGFFTKKFEFPSTYKPTSLQSYLTDVHNVNSIPKLWYGVFQANLIDTGGSSRYDNVRPLAYMNADVFLLCFDVTDTTSLASVQSKWLPEIRKYEPKTPVILIGTKADLKKE